MQKVPLTRQGAESLREELNRLKRVERPKITTAIAEARAHGDLKENAEYHAAREQQSFNEGRIKELESVLSHAQIIDQAQHEGSTRIVFGATVELADADSGDEVTYQIVGELEADLSAGRISVNSPVARALIGSEQGDEVNVQTPGGQRTYEILTVRYQ